MAVFLSTSASSAASDTGYSRAHVACKNGSHARVARPAGRRLSCWPHGRKRLEADLLSALFTLCVCACVSVCLFVSLLYSIYRSMKDNSMCKWLLLYILYMYMASSMLEWLLYSYIRMQEWLLMHGYGSIQ